jgi:hypothetical protein
MSSLLVQHMERVFTHKIHIKRKRGASTATTSASKEEYNTHKALPSSTQQQGKGFLLAPNPLPTTTRHQPAQSQHWRLRQTMGTTTHIRTPTMS